MNNDLMVFFQEIIYLKIKDGACVTNLDEYADVDTHLIVLFCNRNETVYFDSFGVEHVPEEIKEFVRKRHKSKLFSSTSKQFSNVSVFLHWIH